MFYFFKWTILNSLFLYRNIISKFIYILLKYVKHILVARAGFEPTSFNRKIERPYRSLGTARRTGHNFCSGRGIRTLDLLVMSQPSWPLLHPAIYFLVACNGFEPLLPNRKVKCPKHQVKYLLFLLVNLTELYIFLLTVCFSFEESARRTGHILFYKDK